jgi:hypothetical protein
LRVGDLLDRHLHAKIAARDHDAVSDGKDFVVVRERIGTLNFRDNERHAADLHCRSAHGLDVRGALDERLAHCIHAGAQRKLKAGAVVLGERANAEIDAGQIEAFPGAQFAADGDGALHVIAGDALYHELHEAVVQKEPVPRFDHARQRLKAHGDTLGVAHDIFAREGEMAAGHELDRLGLDLAEAHLRPGQIGHDSHPPAGGAFRVANTPNELRMMRKLAV